MHYCGYFSININLKSGSSGRYIDYDLFFSRHLFHIFRFKLIIIMMKIVHLCYHRQYKPYLMLPPHAIGNFLLATYEVITSLSCSIALLSEKNRNHGGWPINSWLFLGGVLLKPKGIRWYLVIIQQVLNKM